MMFRPLHHICGCAKYYAQMTSPTKIHHLRTITNIKDRRLFSSKKFDVAQNGVTATSSHSIGKSSTGEMSFTPVYRFNYIVHLKVLARLKIYQTVLTVAFVPPSFYLHSTGALSSQQLTVSLGIASLACTMLYVISFVIRKVVGMLSISEDKRTVKISHLSFWGKKKEVLCDITDIVPLADMSENRSDIFVRLKRYSNDDSFHFFLRHGKIIDANKIEDIIGSLK